MSDAALTQTPRLSTTVRLAVAADCAAIATLINRAYEVEKFFAPGLRTNIAEVTELLERGAFLVLDRLDRSLAAVIYVEPHAPLGYFGMLSVSPEHQGAGLGRRLVAVAEALCMARGCRDMELLVVNLRTELPPWYRSLGYTETGTKPWSKDELSSQPCHFIRMSKSLAA